jgi:hypothetical protein
MEISCRLHIVLPVVNKLKANESTNFEIQVLQTLFKVSDIKKVTFHVDAQ